VIHHRQGPFAPDVSPERARIRAVVIPLAVEHGIPNLTAEMVCRAAAVDLPVFTEHFAGIPDCCMQIYVANIDEFDRIVFGAVECTDGWPDRLRVSAYATARYLRTRSLEARFNFVEMLEAGDEAQVYRDRYVRRIVALIDEGRSHHPEPDSLGDDVALAAFGSIYEFLVRQFQSFDDIAQIERHVPGLMYLAVRPYLGHEAARAELTIPPPPEDDFS
jgi:AcrR family transcriptional regulator